MPELARRGGRSKPIALFSAMQAEREIAATTGAGARFVAWGEADYPEPLAAIADAPPLIVVTGRDQILNKPAVAVVGARNASANGVRLTRRIAGELGEKGLIVVSGLARGIDAAAHEGSLETGTIAVTAGGIDVVYPAQNEELHRRITDSGAILTEIAFGIQPQARHFPRRNRIISGLALGVLVVEAAPRSGSLITARFALEQGREVFAVPGSPLDPRARGTNNLDSRRRRPHGKRRRHRGGARTAPAQAPGGAWRARVSGAGTSAARRREYREKSGFDPRSTRAEPGSG